MRAAPQPSPFVVFRTSPAAGLVDLVVVGDCEGAVAQGIGAVAEFMAAQGASVDFDSARPTTCGRRRTGRWRANGRAVLPVQGGEA